jgi:hypothetical protein
LLPGVQLILNSRALLVGSSFGHILLIVTKTATRVATIERLALTEEARTGEAVARILTNDRRDRSEKPAIAETIANPITGMTAVIGNLVPPPSEHKIALRVPSTHDAPPCQAPRG